MNYRTATAFVAAFTLISSALQAATPATATVKSGDTIAFLGDSITAGGANYGGYCRLVIQGLKMKGIRATPVLAGVSGNTSADMVQRLQSAVLDRHPNWVVLAAGVNDVWHGDPTVRIGVFQPKPGMGVSLDGYRKNVTEIVDRCAKAGAKVILTTITPIREDPTFKLNRTAETYNAFLHQLAKDRELPIADLNAALFAEIAKGKRLTSDGVHPLAAGHREMAKGILRTMGFNEKDVAQAEQEWEAAAQMLILGDKQTRAGTRTGGWCHLLMDGMNSGRDMVTFKVSAPEPATLRKLLASCRGDLNASNRYQYVLLQAPKSDVEHATPQDQYRQAITELIDLTREKGVKLVIATIPVPNDDPGSELSQKLEPYNQALREVAKTQRIPLADIHQAMADCYTKNPKSRLTLDGARFNRPGGMLMAETIMRALGLEERLTTELRKTWDERVFYGSRYQAQHGDQ